jgi:hypothetical protein
MGDRDHLHAVPNPPNNGNGNALREMIKTVAITSAVSALVGVFAVEGGRTLWALMRRAVMGKPPAPNMPAYAQWNGPAPSHQNPWENEEPPYPPQYAPPAPGDDLPEGLRSQPHLRPTARRKKGVSGDELRSMFQNFATNMDKRFEERFSNLEKRIDDSYEADDEDDD